MLKKTILSLILLLTTNLIAQENSFFNKTYPNSNASIEFGLGYIFNTSNENSLIRYQIVSRNLLLNERLGFMYTLESPLDEGIDPNSSANEINDLFGLNYRLSNDFSFQAASGLAGNSVFKAKDGLNGVRKAISITYHPDNTPFTITTGYSGSFGPSLTVNYRFSFNKKKSIKKVDKKSIAIEKSIKKTQITKKISEKITPNINLENIIKKPIQQKVIQKVIKKPTINTKKLCNESKVLYPLNMYDLSSSEKSNLIKLSEYLKGNPRSKLTIFGSTDKSGSEEYNLKLSVKRANSSKNYLIKLGVSGKQLEIIALGESKSQNDNSKLERAKARSTTFKITSN